MIRVSLIEDNNYMREGWETFIGFEKDMHVAGSFSNCEDALSSGVIEDTDILLLDINLPGMSGIECIEKARDLNSEISIIMATVHEDDEHIFAAIKSGAAGYLMKKVTPEQLVKGIRDAYEGGSPISPGIARRVIQTFQQLEETSVSLSEKETEILQLLAKGMSYAAIGRQIFLTVDGVRHHIRNIYKKLEVNSKSEAVAKGIQKKIIDP
jgi:DNA-binding NarL/FixJ family response regulator